MDPEFKKYSLRITGAISIKETEVIQPLWSNYGKISRYVLDGKEYDSFIVKYIDLRLANEHPRGWKSDLAHNRKVKSYDVESNWYNEWNQSTNENCRTPKYIGSFSKQKEKWIVLEDLKTDYPLTKKRVDLEEVKAGLSWLAYFHSTFMNKKPVGLWKNGTYWHLDTRPEELDNLKHDGLKTYANQIDQLLNNCKYKTIIHGDAKLANFCFSEDGSVAAVDFQYVGGGCGMKDVTYFLGSCLSAQDSEKYEAELLNAYFAELNKAMAIPNEDFKQIEKEWRGLYNLASADFMRFMLGWMPTHFKVNDYEMKKVNQVLKELSRTD